MIGPDLLTSPRQQLLIVNDPGDLAGVVRQRYPQFEVATASNYMEGIATLAKGATHGLLVGVDPTARKLDDAVAGLRQAAGVGSRIVLCCLPSGEPTARQVLSAGADDYVIYPPTGSELDEALAIPGARVVEDTLPPGAPVPSWEELTALTGVLAGLGEGRPPMLDRLCRLLADTMRTPFVRIIVESQAAHVPRGTLLSNGIFKIFLCYLRFLI